MAITLDNPTTLTLPCDYPASAEGGLCAMPSDHSSAAQPASTGYLCVSTTRFGELSIDPETVLTFADGLIGFERCTRYALIAPDSGSAFRWLQSLEEPGVAFPILEPAQFRADYAPTISDSDARSLQLTATTPMLLFVIVTIPPHNPQAMTANLLGPLVVNAETRRARQMIVLDEGYTTRYRIVEGSSEANSDRRRSRAA